MKVFVTDIFDAQSAQRLKSSNADAVLCNQLKQAVPEGLPIFDANSERVFLAPKSTRTAFSTGYRFDARLAENGSLGKPKIWIPTGLAEKTPGHGSAFRARFISHQSCEIQSEIPKTTAAVKEQKKRF